MSADIIAIDPSKPINNRYAICSTLPTGIAARWLVRENHPKSLTIENIESKFDNRFDDPSYYFGSIRGASSGDSLDGGDLDDGDLDDGDLDGGDL